MTILLNQRLKSSFNIERNVPRRKINSSSERAVASSPAGKRWEILVLPLVVVSLFYVMARLSDRSDPYAKPFCDADGFCYEHAYIPSPRTVYSAWNKEQYNLWWKYYHTLEQRTLEYASKRQALYDNSTTTTPNTRPLLLLGDSITEAWDGTGLGRPRKRAKGVPEILQQELSGASGLDPVVLGVSGDQTQHLLYRLHHGHMRAAQLLTKNTGRLEYDPSAVFVVMIGTNNLGSGELPGPTAKGVLAVAEKILEETKDKGCKLVLFQVLPRGDGKKVLPQLCPPRCSNRTTKTPYSSFLPAIDKVNEELTTKVNELQKTYTSSKIELIDCGEAFRNRYYDPNARDSYEVRPGLMPDMLHPNAEGHKILAKCIRDSIAKDTRKE